MAPQACKVVNTHTHEIQGWKIISRLLHSRAPHLGGMNGDVQSDLFTLTFNNAEKLEYFNSIIIRLQQEIIFYGEIVSPTIFLFHYMKELSKIDKTKTFIVPKMTDLPTLIGKNGKLSVYTEGNFHGIYLYLEIIGSPTTLTTPGKLYHHFGTSSSTNNDTSNLHKVISAIHMR